MILEYLALLALVIGGYKLLMASIEIGDDLRRQQRMK